MEGKKKKRSSSDEINGYDKVIMDMSMVVE